MGFNIFPEKIVKTRETAGGFTSEVYDIETWRDIGFLGIVIVLAIIAIFAPVFGGLLLIFQCMTKTENDETINLFSILAAGYILFDIKKQWFISVIMRPFYDANEIKEVININGGIILSGFVLLFAGDIIFKILGRSRFLYFIFVVVMTFVTYNISKGFIHQIVKIN